MTEYITLKVPRSKTNDGYCAFYGTDCGLIASEINRMLGSKISDLEVWQYLNRCDYSSLKLYEDDRYVFFSLRKTKTRKDGAYVWRLSYAKKDISEDE